MAEWVLKGSIQGPAGEIPDVSQFAKLSDLEGYLELSGGTLTGNVAVDTGSTEPNVSIKRTIDGSTPCEALLRLDSEGVAGLRLKVNGETVNNLYLEQTKTRLSKPLDVASGGVPTGGVQGQILTKGANGAEWADSIQMGTTAADIALVDSAAIVDDPANPTSGIVLKTNADTKKTVITGVGDKAVDEVYISDLDASATGNRAVNKNYVDQAIEGIDIPEAPNLDAFLQIRGGSLQNGAGDDVDSLFIMGDGTTMSLSASQTHSNLTVNGPTGSDKKIRLQSSSSGSTFTMDDKSVGGITDAVGSGTGNALATDKAVKDYVEAHAGDALPEGGTAGQILTKTADGEEWADAPQTLPEGGTDGQVLTSDGAGGAAWESVPQPDLTGVAKLQTFTENVDVMCKVGAGGELALVKGIYLLDSPGNPVSGRAAFGVDNNFATIMLQAGDGQFSIRCVDDGVDLYLGSKSVSSITDAISAGPSGNALVTDKAVANYVADNLKADFTSIEKLDANTVDISTLGPGTYLLSAVAQGSEEYNDTLFPDEMVYGNPDSGTCILNVYGGFSGTGRKHLELFVIKSAGSGSRYYATTDADGTLLSKDSWKTDKINLNNAVTEDNTNSAVTGKAVADYVAANAGSSLPEGDYPFLGDSGLLKHYVDGSPYNVNRIQLNAVSGSGSIDIDTNVSSPNIKLNGTNTSEIDVRAVLGDPYVTLTATSDDYAEIATNGKFTMDSKSVTSITDAISISPSGNALVTDKAVADYVAANAGSGLPEGGTEGQALVKTATGAEWKSLAASDDDFCTYFGIPSMT